MAFSLVDNLWAKSSPYKTLYAHLAETGACAVSLMKNGIGQTFAEDASRKSGLPQESIISLVGYLASLHDIGKVHPFHQKNQYLPILAVIYIYQQQNLFDKFSIKQHNINLNLHEKNHFHL